MTLTVPVTGKKKGSFIQKTYRKPYVNISSWKLKYEILWEAGLSFVKKQLHSKNWSSISLTLFVYIHRQLLAIFHHFREAESICIQAGTIWILLIWWDWIVHLALIKPVLPCCNSIGSHCQIHNTTFSAGVRNTIKSSSTSWEDSSQFRQIPGLDYYNSIYSAYTRRGKF